MNSFVPTAHASLTRMTGVDDQVWCDTPAGPECSLVLTVSLNGQQFTNTSLSFYRYAPPLVRTLSPASGPTLGETLVLAYGNSSLRAVNYSEPRCRFGGSNVVHGTLIASTSSWAMRCTAPSGVSSGAVEVSLNAQQYSRAGVQ